MKTVYVDAEYKCHVINDGTMTAVEDPFFNDKCDTLIEGYCYKVEDDVTYIYPWKDLKELEESQRSYETQLLRQYEALIEALYEQAVTG